MNKNYFLVLILLIPLLFFGQSSSVFPPDEALPPYPTAARSTQYDIQDLRLYPNPVTQNHGKVTITTARNLIKEIAIFDVLGKRVLERRLSGNVLDVSSLNAGIYVIKVTENSKTAFRKLVIR